MNRQHSRIWSVVAAAGILLAAGGPVLAQHASPGGGAHGAPSAGHTGGGHAAPGGHAPQPGPNQHLDGRFGHNQYYYNPGYAVRRAPAGSHEFRDHDGRRFRFDHGNWYRWNGGSWIIWTAPFGLFVPLLPPYYTTLWWYGVPYYYANDTYYQWDDNEQQYEVVPPPDGIEANGSTQTPASDQLFVYPSHGQSDAQQAQDRAACQQWARAQTGYDPNVPGGSAAEQAVQKRNDYFRAQVSCLEGRGYTVR
jgi:hypothetical protein